MKNPKEDSKGQGWKGIVSMGSTDRQYAGIQQEVCRNPAGSMQVSCRKYVGIM
jgi:hypothetical protein